MKLLDTWKDIDYGVVNSIYQLNNGVRLIITHNKQSVDFDFSIVIRAGSYFERQVGVPQGTAHLLEHILFGNPNDTFKTRETLDSYLFGTKHKPEISANASTSRSYLYIYTHGNRQGWKRMLRYALSALGNPQDRIDKYYDKERKIVHGEIQRRQKESRSSSLQYEKFFWGDVYPEFAEDVLGSEESLESISKEHIQSYYDAVHTPDNIVLAIQTNLKVTKLQLKHIESYIEKQLCNYSFARRKSALHTKVNTIDTAFKYKHFSEPNNRGVFFSINFFYDLPKKIDYKKDKLAFLMSSLMWKIAHEHLREEKHLIYDVNIANFKPCFIHKGRGFSLSCSKEALAEVLNESFKMLYDNYWKTYLDTPAGEKWLTNFLSSEIFRRNKDFNGDYAESLATDVLDKSSYMKFDFKASKAAAQEITKKDVVAFITQFLKIPPGFWFVSPFEDKEIEDIFLKSDFYKHFRTKG